MNHFSELQSQHESLLQQESAGATILQDVQAYIEDVRFKSSDVSAAQEREQLRANTRYWASYVFAQTGKFPNTELTPFSGVVEETAVSSRPLLKYIIIGIVTIAILSLIIASLIPDKPEADLGELAFLETRNAEIAVTNTAVARTIASMATTATAASMLATTTTPTIELTPTPTPFPLRSLNTVTVENMKTIQQLAVLTGHKGAVLDIDFNPNGQQLVSSGEDGTVIVWDIDNVNLLSTQTIFQQWLQQSVTYNASGTQVAIGGNDRVVTIINLAETLPFAQFTGHEGFVFGLDYTPDGSQLVSGDGNGVLKIWDVYSGGLLSTTTLGKSAILELDFNQTQDLLAVANATDGFKLLAYPSLRPFCTVDNESVLTTAFADDGKSIVFGNQKGQLISVDPNSRGCSILDTIQAHAGSVNSVAFSSRGGITVSGGADGIVFVMPGEISLAGHTSAVESVAINPAGTLIASASADGTIILWGVPNK